MVKDVVVKIGPYPGFSIRAKVDVWEDGKPYNICPSCGHKESTHFYAELGCSECIKKEDEKNGL